MFWIDINRRICFMPSDGGGGSSGGDGPGGDSGGDGDSSANDGGDIDSGTTYDGGSASDTQALENDPTSTNDFDDGNGDYDSYDGGESEDAYYSPDETADLNEISELYTDDLAYGETEDENLGGIIASYDPVTGVTTYEGVESTILGITYTEDVHSISGSMLGTYDELVADALEVFGITVDRENINAAESIVELGIALAMGASGIGLAVSATRAANDLGLATGSIDQTTHDAINTGLAVVGFMNSAYEGLQAISNGVAAIDAGYGALGALSIAKAAISISVALGRLDSAMRQAGLDSNSFVDMDSVFSRTDGENWSGLNVDVAANMLIDSLEDEINRIDDMLSNDLLGQGEADTYDYLAGGMYYDIKLAGEDLSNPLNESFEVSAENKDIMVSDEVVQMNLQTDGIEPLWNLLPLPVAELSTKA